MKVAPRYTLSPLVVKLGASVKVGANTVCHCKKSLRIILSVSVNCCARESKDAPVWSNLALHSASLCLALRQSQ